MAADHSSHPYDATGEREPSFANPGKVAMLLFLAALAMLFAASLFGYVYTRIRNRTVLPEGIHLPAILWLSTAMVIGVSAFIARAARQLRGVLIRTAPDGKRIVAVRHDAYRKSLLAATALAVGFVTLQIPALIGLLAQHRQLRAARVHLYGLLFFVILLHALHVIGGLFSLVKATLQAHRGQLAFAKRDALRHTAMYWHFLDAVWIVMFATFLILR